MSENQNTPVTPSADMSFVNFAYMTETALEALRKHFHLQMCIGSLQTCQAQYRLLRREPTVDELYLLDALIAENELLSDTYLPAEMKTEDPLVAETFANMMARRSAASLNKERPSSLTELSQLAESYLQDTAPNTNPLDQIVVRFTSHRELSLAADGYLRTATTGNTEEDIAIGVRSTESAFRGGKPVSGDYVYAILKEDEQDESFETRLVEYLCTNEVKKATKSALHLCGTTPLGALIRTSLGLSLTETAATREEGATRALVTRAATGIVLIAAPAASADLLLSAQERGFCVRLIAKITAGDSIRLPNGQIFPHGFFPAMIPGRPYSTEIVCPTDSPADIRLCRIGTCTLNGQKHAVVKVDASGENPFAVSVKGLVYALSHCLAAGISPSEVGLSCHLSLPMSPPTPRRLGSSLAAILGLYRVQTEFELRGNMPILQNRENEPPHIAIAMVAPLPQKSPSPSIVGNGSRIYYLEPLYDEKGLPVFEDLKKMYRYVEKLCADGLILSIRPTGEDLLADLDAMSRDITVEYVRDDAIASHFGGLLVETTTPIQGTLIAEICPPTAQKIEENIASEDSAPSMS